MSFGGMVAFEMARQLRAAGQDVNVVMLFDTAAPGTKILHLIQDDAAIARAAAEIGPIEKQRLLGLWRAHSLAVENYNPSPGAETPAVFQRGGPP